MLPAASPARRGLTSAEVEARRREFGSNVLTPPARAPWWRLYLAKFDDPVIRILIVAAGLAVGIGAAEGHVAAEGVGIVVAIFLATYLAFWNEHRASRAFDVLNRTGDSVPTKVVRDGRVTTVSRRDLVVGDTVLVETGDEVPADGRVWESVGLRVSEAKLTGEARPVSKHPVATPGEAPTIPAYHLRRGSVVADGYGGFDITAVGDRTEFGRTLIDSIGDSDKNRTLNTQLAKLSRIIGVVGFGMALLTFSALLGRSAVAGAVVLSPGQWAFAAALALGVSAALLKVWLPVVFDAFDLLGLAVLRPRWLGGEADEEASWRSAVAPWLATATAGMVLFAGLVGLGVAAGWIPAAPSEWLPRAAVRELLRNFMIAVTIVVVAVPEGLAMSVTLSLAYSMRKMTAAQILVRRMDACETIGAITVVCSDKTGTLTLNEMRVFETVFGGTAPSAVLGTDFTLRELVVESIAANSTAHLSRDPGEVVRPVGNPTEGALLLWLESQGADFEAARSRFRIATRWTFDTERKLMATLGPSPALDRPVLHVKGAPEIVLGRCDRLLQPEGETAATEADRAEIAAALRGYQDRGMRTLGFAYRPDPADGGATLEEAARNMIWLGFVAVADPVRPEVPGAIGVCTAAGVAVKVVTGDNAETAREIARQIGQWGVDEPATALLTGSEFAALPDDEAEEAARSLKVLARARPADKLRLVQLLKRRGEVVAVTGDGVNDGPALNHADVGLAMGRTGTAVAKEASDILLLDDSFGGITTAIRWGRSLYENIQRFILFQLTINVVALGMAVLGPFVGFALPLTVMQMLWVNLIMDTFAALALATEPPHEGVLRRPPRDPGAFIVSRAMAASIFGVGGAFLAVLVALIAWLGIGSVEDADAPTRSGTLFFTVFVMLQFWNLFNAKSWGRSGSVFPTLRGNPSFLVIAAAILVGQILIVQLGGSVFRSVPLALADWLAVGGGTSLVLVAGELGRMVKRHRK